MEAGHGGASDVFVPRNLFEGVVGVRVGTALDVMAERSNKNVSCKWIATTLFSVDGLDELKYENNVRLTGRVTNVTEFNAFIESSPGVSDIYVSKSVWGRAELEIGEIRTVIVERHESGQNKWRALSVVDETPTEPEWAEWDGEEQDGFTLVRGKKGNFLVQKPVRVGVLHDDAVEDNSTSASKESFPPYWQSPFPPEAGAYDSAEDIEAGSYVRRGHQGVNMSQIGTKASDEYMRETLASAMDSRIFETRFFAEVNNEQAPGGCDNMRGVQYGAASGSSGQVVMYSANIGQSSAVKEASEEHVRRYILPGGGVTAGGDDDREEDYVTAMNRAHACVYEGDEEDVCKSALKQLGIEPDDECVVCMLGTKEHCLLPCGHKALCIRCADLASFVNEKTRPFKTCPVCRSELQAPWVIPAEMAEKLRVYEC